MARVPLGTSVAPEAPEGKGFRRLMLQKLILRGGEECALFRLSLAFRDILSPLGHCYRLNVVPVCQAPSEGDKAMAKAGKLTILYGEGDQEVLAAQAAVMAKAGHNIQPAEGRKGVEEALRKGNFDLVVLGPTLSRNDRHHLPYMVKKVNPETSVLVMHTDGSRHPYVDACTDTGASLETVLARIEGMRIAGMLPSAAAASAAGR